MDKATFKQLLTRNGYSVDKDANAPTVLLMDATKEDLKKKFIEVKLFAQKNGYHHTIAVRSVKGVEE